jgi:hypothetical protein
MTNPFSTIASDLGRTVAQANPLIRQTLLFSSKNILRIVRDPILF